MQLSDAIQQRRNVKRFTDRPVSRAEIEALLAVAATGPNHRLTEPWRFYVLGPDARQAYGLALANRKARKLEDAEAAARVRETISAEHRALPAMIVVAVRVDENSEIREEDYAAAMMGIENLALTAVAMGLGTSLKTGAVMEDPAARAAAGVAAGERIIAVVNVGEPAEMPAPKPRQPAAALTTWMP